MLLNRQIFLKKPQSPHDKLDLNNSLIYLNGILFASVEHSFIPLEACNGMITSLFCRNQNNSALNVRKVLEGAKNFNQTILHVLKQD